MTWEIDLNYLTWARFAELVVERGAGPRRARLVGDGADDARGAARARAVRRFATGTSGRRCSTSPVDVGGDCLVHLSLSAGAHTSTRRRVMSRRSRGEGLAARPLPGRGPTEQQQVDSDVLVDDRAAGRVPVTRRIDVPTWTEVAGNYPSSVAAALEPLMTPASGRRAAGQLILWHGEPGTGKTYALRALGWEWRSGAASTTSPTPRCSSARRPQYMLDVLLDDRTTRRRRPAGGCSILEDTGELLVADAKERTGQGLSRLLNVVDGLIGQGLRVMVLVTTNEPLRPAAPSRLASGPLRRQVEFVRSRRGGGRPGSSGRAGTARVGPARSRRSSAAPRARAAERRPVGFVRQLNTRPAAGRRRQASVVSTASTRPLYGRGAGSIPAGGSFTRP